MGSGLIHRKGFSSKRRFSFKHALVQDAAYDSLLNRERLERHGLVASALEEDFAEIRRKRVPDLLAFHWRRAGRDEQAVPWLEPRRR